MNSLFGEIASGKSNENNKKQDKLLARQLFPPRRKAFTCSAAFTTVVLGSSKCSS